MNTQTPIARVLPFLGVLACLSGHSASATPSSTFWTPMSPDLQSVGVLHLGVDNYFTVFRKADDGGRVLGDEEGF